MNGMMEEFTTPKMGKIINAILNYKLKTTYLYEVLLEFN